MFLSWPDKPFDGKCGRPAPVSAEPRTGSAGVASARTARPVVTSWV